MKYFIKNSLDQLKETTLEELKAKTEYKYKDPWREEWNEVKLVEITDEALIFTVKEVVHLLY